MDGRPTTSGWRLWGSATARRSTSSACRWAAVPRSNSRRRAITTTGPSTRPTVSGSTSIPCGRAAGTSGGFRRRGGDAKAERITSDDLEDWFPHISPDGKRMVIFSFPKGTAGHNGRLDGVQLRMTSVPARQDRDADDVLRGAGNDQREFVVARFEEVRLRDLRGDRAIITSPGRG